MQHPMLLLAPLLLACACGQGTVAPVPTPATRPAPAAMPRPPATAPVTAAARQLFEVELEQAGKSVVVQRHEAHLAPRPFAIIVRTRSSKLGLLMNVSLKDDTFEIARAGRPLASIFNPGTGVAEDQIIKHHSLYVVEGGHHYLLHDPAGGVRRYHGARRFGFEHRLRREVERVEIFDGSGGSRELSLEKVRTLYLVFYPSPEETDVAERARVFLRLHFDR